MYTYYVLIIALSIHMICINLNTIFYTHVQHSPSKTIYIRLLYARTQWLAETGYL